jgi:vancomycin resistance protein VanJ
MVAGPLTGAEGDEQTGEELPELRLRPGAGIPAQRAEQTPSSGRVSEGTEQTGAAGGPATAPGADPGTTQNPQAPRIPPPGGRPDERTAPAAAGSAGYAAETLSGLEAQGLAAAGPVAAAHPAGGLVTDDAIDSGTGAPAGTGTYGGGADTPGDGGQGRDGGDGASPASRRLARRRHRSAMRRQTSHGIVVLAALAVVFLVLHRFLPDADGIGSLLESWLPWLGGPVGVLLIAACIVHTRSALVATIVAAAVWTALYGPILLPRGSSAPAQLRVFSEDVNGNAREATASGAMAMAQHADVVALEDMYSSVSASSAVDALNAAYPNHVAEYEFGLWSRYKITDVTPIALSTSQPGQSLSLGADDAGLASSSSDVPVIGALEATLATPYGQLVVYLVHLPQPVLGNQGFAKARDQALSQFVGMIEKNPAQHLAVIGDINVATTDRQFGLLTGNDALTSAQQAAGSGFGFTWPAEFPVVRLDDVLTRGMTPLRSVVLPSIASGQTHLPIQVDLDY